MSLVDAAGWAREATVVEPTWPAASPALVTSLLPLLSGSPQSGVQQQLTPVVGHDKVGYAAATVKRVVPSVSLELALRYSGLETIIVDALGLEPRVVGEVTIPEELAPGVYRHVFELDVHLSTMEPWVVPGDGITEDDLNDLEQRKVRRATVALVRDGVVWEYLSAMVNQLNFDIDLQQTRCRPEWFAHSINKSSIVNTPTTMAQAQPLAGPSVLLHHGIMRIAPYSESVALDDEDAIGIMTWNCTLQNALADQSGPRVGNAPEEFERGRTPVLNGSFTLPRYDSDVFSDGWRSGQLFMMDMKFTGPEILATGIPYQLNFYVPGLRVTQAEPTGPSVARAHVPVQWTAIAPDELPAGFPTFMRSGSLLIEVVSRVGEHQLL